MSATKDFAKFLTTATPEEREAARQRLETALAAERNPMKKSSLKARLRMLGLPPAVQDILDRAAGNS
jgi:hypothetical protein